MSGIVLGTGNTVNQKKTHLSSTPTWCQEDRKQANKPTIKCQVVTAEGTGGELHYLAGRHHRRLLSGGVEGSPFLLFLSCLQCEKGSVRKGRMDQFSVMVAAFCYDKGCAWYTTGTSLLDVAGGSRSRIKPSFNNS